MRTCPACPVTVVCDRASRLPSVVGLTPLHFVAGCPRTGHGKPVRVGEACSMFFFSLLLVVYAATNAERAERLHR